jgi:hypothetical protein
MIEPIPVPTRVMVQVGAQYIEIPIEDLNEQQLAELAAEFIQRLFEMAGKKLK